MIFTYYPNKESYAPTYFLMWELPSLLASGTTRESFENFKKGKITKEQLPIIVASGLVEPGKKTNENVTQHSGLILLDLDKKDNPDIEKKIKDINRDKYTYFSFRSPHDGFKVGIYTSIRDVNEHAKYYDAISDYYSKKYSVVCDNRCRNIGRFCFLPYDENNYYTPYSETFRFVKGTNDELLPKNNLVKKDNNGYSANDPNSSKILGLEKKDNSGYGTNVPKSFNSLCVQKGDNSMYRNNDQNFILDSNSEKRDNNTYNGIDYNIDSLIKKGTYAGIIFSNTRYINIKNIMSTIDPFFQKYLNPDILDYSTRIDEAYFSGVSPTYYVEGGIPVCQIRFSKEYKIITGKRNKTLGSICLKLIFNNPFAACDRIQQEILALNDKYCEEPLTSKECIDIVSYNHGKFLRGELDFSKVIRQNKKGICRQYVFFSRTYNKTDPVKTHNLAVEAFKAGNIASKTNLIHDAIESLKTGQKITINRIAEYLKTNEKMIDRNLTLGLKELYKSYNKTLQKRDF
jgi:VirE N-terminal domain